MRRKHDLRDLCAGGQLKLVYLDVSAYCYLCAIAIPICQVLEIGNDHNRRHALLLSILGCVHPVFAAPAGNIGTLNSGRITIGRTKNDSNLAFGVDAFVGIDVLRLYEPAVAGKYQLRRRDFGGACSGNVISTKREDLIVKLYPRFRFVDQVSTQSDLLKITAVVARRFESPA